MTTPATRALLLATGCTLFFLPSLPAQAKPGSRSAAQGAEPTAELTVDPSHTVSPVSPMLYGLMTEEINHSYDGGLYAELVQNRTMRHSWEGFAGWTAVERGHSHTIITPDTDNGPSLALPESLKLTVTDAAPGSEGGVANSGWWGIAVRPGTVYKGAFYASTDTAQPLTARLIADDTGAVLAEATVALHTGDWSQYTYTLTTARTLPGSGAPGARNHLELTLAQPGTVSLQSVSLMPPTYHDRANGLRPDLMEKLAAMHPRFVRLPGGNYLEGDSLADWYDWKKTIGPIVDRPGHQAPWTYWSTDGLGLLEFLEWTEDLHVEPVLAVYAGYGLKGEHFQPGADLEPFVQAALDEVEYVTGDANTKWGAQRVKDGHPAPFPLHYIEIGNEDNFDRSGSYPARFTQFATALRAKYPQYKLIATTKLAETKASAKPDLLDDHYYLTPAEMFAKAHFYDTAPRPAAGSTGIPSSPKIFVGEWATRSGTPTPNFGDALGDAAWMTGLERNSDLIEIASYAPLLTNVNPGAMQWSTDLIGFDALTSYGSPSFYAQSLFASHLGDGTAKSTLSGAGPRFFYSATVDSKTHVLHLKLVNASSLDQPMTLNLGDRIQTRAERTTLHAASFAATNSIDRPEFIHPVSSTVNLRKGAQPYTVPALTIEVLDIPLQP